MRTDKDKERWKAYTKKYRKEHSEQIKAYQKKWNSEHKEQIKAAKKKTQAKCKEKYNKNTKRLYYELKDKAYGMLGDKCVRCGFTDKRALQIDHINGGGAIERRASGIDNGRSVYRRIINLGTSASGKYQILCANCNWIKRHENNE